MQPNNDLKQSNEVTKPNEADNLDAMENSNRPFNIQSSIAPQQRSGLSKGKIAMLAAALLLVLSGIIAAYMFFSSQGTANVVDNVATSTNDNTKTETAAKTLDITDSKVAVKGNVFQTACYSLDIPNGADKSVLEKSSSGCSVNYYSPGNNPDQINFLIKHPVVGSGTYDEAIARYTKDNTYVNSGKLTINGAEMTVFKENDGPVGTIIYIVKAPGGKFQYRTKSEEQKYEGKNVYDINVFTMVATYYTNKPVGATVVDNMMKSFKFLD